jgi:hypothetical protein
LCLQFHPAKSEYVNLHNHCLHIWQPPKELEKYLEDFYKLAESIE